MIDTLAQPWPWYVAGPIIGLMVPALRLVGGKLFGVSANLRHACAALLPSRSEFLRYDWKRAGGWNLAFALGIVLGGVIAGTLLATPGPVAVSAATRADLVALGLRDLSGLVPADLYTWASLLTARGLLVLVGGGFLIGFGARYAGGCTSGHAIAGLATFQMPSLIAVIGFFAGGLIATHLLLPLVFAW